MRTILLTTLLFFVLTAIGQKELAIGSIAPDFSIADNNGKQIQLSKLIERGPVVITFYRGEWCPHCNNYMMNLQDSLAMIEEYNATVIAITPESEMYIDESIDKTGATFSIIWDENHLIMDAYQVTFKLSNSKNAVYKVAGINVAKASGSDHRMLPVPATYIVGKDGLIKGSFYNEDYSLRMPVKDILDVLQNIDSDQGP